MKGGKRKEKRRGSEDEKWRLKHSLIDRLNIDTLLKPLRVAFKHQYIITKCSEILITVN